MSACRIANPASESQKTLMLELSKFSEVIETAVAELAPHKICKFIYDLSNAFNHFYHETKILLAENEEDKKGYIALISITKDILETCADLLGIESPERM